MNFHGPGVPRGEWDVPFRCILVGKLFVSRWIHLVITDPEKYLILLILTGNFGLCVGSWPRYKGSGYALDVVRLLCLHRDAANIIKWSLLCIPI